MRSKPVPREFLGAFKQGHRRNTREFIDHDYTDDLLRRAKAGCKDASDALAFLTKFNNEYYKKVLKKDDPDAFHQAPDQRADCYNRGNAIERDMFANFTRLGDLVEYVDVILVLIP